MSCGVMPNRAAEATIVVQQHLQSVILLVGRHIF